MRRSYTPSELRTLAKQVGPQWSGEARAALSFAADVIDAANAVIAQLINAKPPPLTEENKRLRSLLKDASRVFKLDSSALTLTEAIDTELRKRP